MCVVSQVALHTFSNSAPFRSKLLSFHPLVDIKVYTSWKRLESSTTDQCRNHGVRRRVCGSVAFSNPASKFPTRPGCCKCFPALTSSSSVLSFSNNLRFSACFINDQRLDLFSEDHCWCLQNRYPKGIDKIHLLAFSVHLRCCAREGASILAASVPDYCQPKRRTRPLAGTPAGARAGGPGARGGPRRGEQAA